ncbi:piggyBac transposable element-derived protein 4-like [Lineus longissimus]|uniref:piggyBac transposable element-derived protein 4-like n=1 Tax=Lineus longissimus TaxID=88925 RepID=UPI00315D6E68
MPCDRFLLLCKFLHFADNTMMDPGIPNVSRKLYKLYPILNHLRQKFKSVYQPEQEIAIDESLMMWKGRLGWKQYIPSKRARFGIKSYELCESQSGYIWDFFIYTGQDTEYRAEYRDNPSMGAKVVLSLAHPLLDQGYGINMDNFFSSPVLFDFLCQHETDAVGTIRSNRKGLPVQMKQKRLKKGESCEYYRDDIDIPQGLKTKILFMKDHNCVDNIEKLYFSVGYEAICIFCGRARDEVEDTEDDCFPYCANCSHKQPLRR